MPAKGSLSPDANTIDKIDALRIKRRTIGMTNP